MEKKKIIYQSLLHAVAVLLYIFAVALILMYGSKVFPKVNETVLGPIAFLLLFVVSAAVTGSLVLAKPIMLYLEKQKKDSILFFVSTVIWLALFALIFIISNVLIG